MMFSKIFQYAYLVFAALFLYDGIMKWDYDKSASYISLGLAALAIFMFFFRRKFNKKLQNKDKSN
jgi:hypothetical protein